MFTPKIKGNTLVENLITSLSPVASKAFIIKEIFTRTGIKVSKTTISTYQKCIK